MSFVQSPAGEPTLDQHIAECQSLDLRLPSKRKWDDVFPSSGDYDGDDDSSNLVIRRMHKQGHNAGGFSSLDDGRNYLDTVCNYAYRSSASKFSPGASSSSSAQSQTPYHHLQFFVRSISEGSTICIRASPYETIKSIHAQIHLKTGIPAVHQRLIYLGKQLQLEQSVAECLIKKDCVLHLVGRLRSTQHPQAWQILEAMITSIRRLCRGESVLSGPKVIMDRMTEYLSLTPKDYVTAADYFQIFLLAAAPEALIMLRLSPVRGNKECADSSVKHFLSSVKTSLTKSMYIHCAPIVLEFCKLLKKLAPQDPLYLSCRSTLGSLLESHESFMLGRCCDGLTDVVLIQDVFPFVVELADSLSKDLELSIDSISYCPLFNDVRVFADFVHPLRTALAHQIGIAGVPVSLPLRKRGFDPAGLWQEIACLHDIFKRLLSKVRDCLMNMGPELTSGGTRDVELIPPGWSQYLAILKELHGISKLYQGAEQEFLNVLRCNKTSFCALITKFAKRIDDHQWILEYKDLTNFEARRHLAMMMLPEMKEDYEELHEMLIDRSQLLAESFEYIGRADPDQLLGGLFMEFKNEEATGPGVLREWFFLVCQSIFSPQAALFSACPNDLRRFHPNPASKVNSMHLDYFCFSGRVIALALLHKVQVGVTFDRVFFMQLAGKEISLDDINDADPCLYSSCKQILQMDPDFVDSDALALTFVREVEELGSRTVVELCNGGKDIIVNSKNREKYVDSLIQNHFVTSVSEQVSSFAKGFADILLSSDQQKFFQSLELEDLDWMLCGSGSHINIADWKAHTEYNGFKETDPQIDWFWKVVAELSLEQQQVLLFFWTSVKFLPIDGFRGLSSRLYIYKSPETCKNLPSSHTCFYRICFPVYPSLDVMRESIRIITQEHVGCSFGTW